VEHAELPAAQEQPRSVAAVLLEGRRQRRSIEDEPIAPRSERQHVKSVRLPLVREIDLLAGRRRYARGGGVGGVREEVDARHATLVLVEEDRRCDERLRRKRRRLAPLARAPVEPAGIDRSFAEIVRLEDVDQETLVGGT